VRRTDAEEVGAGGRRLAARVAVAAGAPARDGDVAVEDAVAGEVSAGRRAAG
jgi:hypothetical protein